MPWVRLAPNAIQRGGTSDASNENAVGSENASASPTIRTSAKPAWGPPWSLTVTLRDVARTSSPRTPPMVTSRIVPSDEKSPVIVTSVSPNMDAWEGSACRAGCPAEQLGMARVRAKRTTMRMALRSNSPPVRRATSLTARARSTREAKTPRRPAKVSRLRVA